MTGSILVVEDDGVSAKLLCGILKSFFPDCRVEAEGFGARALERALALKPLVVLLDLELADLHGFEVLSLLKAEEALKATPVLIVTANDDLESEMEGFRRGASDYIIKPFNGHEIAARVGAHAKAKLHYDEVRELNEQITATRAALVESEKMAAVGSLAAGVAHEFNNLLFMIGGHIQLGLREPTPQRLGRMSSITAELVGRGKTLVNELLSFSRGEAGEERVAADLNELLARELDMLAHNFREEGIAVELSASPLPEIKVCKTQFSRIVSNLLLNALDAMRGCREKKLAIVLGPCSMSDCNCPCATAQNSGVKCVELTVRDSGCGISPQIRGKLFHPFMSTKQYGGGGVSGKGLGLFICYGIVRKHGGRITFESEPGKGTEFKVRLPVNGSLCASGDCGKA